MLRGKVLYLDRDDVELPEGRYFLQDLIGLKAVDGNTGREYGVLQEVLPTGANDVYRIVDGAGREFLFPAVKHMIQGVDLEKGIIALLPFPASLTAAGRKPDMRVDILTLFPEMFPPVLDHSIVGRARKKGLLQVCCHQLRQFSPDSRGAWMTPCSAAGRECCWQQSLCQRHRRNLRTFGVEAAYSLYVPPWEGSGPGGCPAPGAAAGAADPVRPL